MKKLILVVGSSLGIFGLLFFGLYLVLFSNTAPLSQRSELSGGAIQIKDGFVSVGIIPSGPNQVILVDCGYDKNATAVLSELNQQGYSRDSVKAVFITHGHSDHIQGCSAFPKAELYALAPEQGLLEGRVGSRSPLGSLMGKKNSQLNIKHYLANAETTTIGNQKVIAYFIPGHTDGSAAFLIAGTVYLGDSADSGKDGQLRPAKWLFSNNVEENHQSLKHLAEQLRPIASEIRALEFAHSSAIQGIGPLLDFSAKN